MAKKQQVKTPKKQATTAGPSKKPVAAKGQNTLQLAFHKENYTYMFIGLGLLVLGFLLMIGGGSDTVIKFSPSIFDFRRLTLAPILILAGYGVELYAIMKRPNDKSQITNSKSQTTNDK